MSLLEWIFGKGAEWKPPLGFDVNEYSKMSMEHEKWLIEKAIEMKKLEVEELRLKENAAKKDATQ
jgi:hypothetical protein